ncbi:phosphodiester glycosidase family protein [Mycoplasmatota bacterium]|nr:phosphodiester glycosidase family protein [Mycoplasmatota bacterium]
MGRKIKQIFLGIILSFIFTNSIYVSADEAQDFKLNLGDVTKYDHEQISDILYERFEIAGNDGIKRVAFKAAFDQKSSNVDMVLWDNYIDANHYKKATVMEIAKNFEEETGRKVYAAVNGDFFLMSYPQDKNLVGKTLHTYMKDGKEIVYGWETKLTNFGFNNQGEYKIQTGVLTLDTQKKKILRVYLDDNNYKDFDIDKLDKMVIGGEVGIYTPASKQINGTFTGKYIAKVENNNYDYPIKANIVRDSNQELLTNSLVDIPSGHIGIAVNSFGQYISGEAQFFYETLQNGQKIEILEKEHYSDSGFENLNYVVGGRTKLVLNREITPEGTSIAVGPTSTHPRTTLGVTVDGEFFIQVIDGRQSGYSTGLTTRAQAQLAYDLGAKDAIELDGGGSTTFILRVNDELQVVNRPSNDNRVLRPVGNAVLFVEAVGSELSEEVPNCEAYSNLEACKTTTTETETTTENTTTTDTPIDNNNDNDNDNNNTNIYIISAIVGVMVIGALGALGVTIKRKR